MKTAEKLDLSQLYCSIRSCSNRGRRMKWKKFLL
ncbi:MAG: hypothetical protein DBX38_02245 [Eubacteriales Family XIII. Incertae Sedis bacterium]|nr:MAG: hypothetical protein DBX38_02245 [Clostridiales Family XIII bacterium]